MITKKNRLIQIGEIIETYDVPKATLYRWMKAHPNMNAGDADSPLGHPFPQPAGRLDRKGLWDSNEVADWWEANARIVGRHPKEDPTVIMPFEVFDETWKSREIVHATDDETGEKKLIRDDIRLLVKGVDILGDEVRLRFHTPSDAVMFRLKY